MTGMRLWLQEPLRAFSPELSSMHIGLGDAGRLAKVSRSVNLTSDEYLEGKWCHFCAVSL